MATLVVGTDGSPNANAALQWALDYARRNDTVLRVVHAWHYPYAASEAGAMVAQPLHEFEQAARQVLETSLQTVDTTGVVVERSVVQGGAAGVLLDESKSADLLVVGARGHGGFIGLMLGSVATHCARHAHVPTVVVPHTTGGDPD
jgi:nucleotide-binding universal stress UspA family protein